MTAMQTQTRGAYLRFGDGDVNLLEGVDDMMQSASRRLMIEMRDTFSQTGNAVLKRLPLHSPRFGIFPGMKPGVHGASDEWAERLLPRCFGYST